MANVGHYTEDAVIRWRRSARRLVYAFFAAVVLSCAAGYVETVTAQSSQRETVATQIAVTQNQVGTLQQQQTALVSRMDVMDNKLSSISDRLSNMQGIGTGAICLLTILNMAGIGLNFYSKRP